MKSDEGSSPVRFKKIASAYPCATEGERLYLFIRGELLDSALWGDLRAALTPTGRAEGFAEMFQQMIAVNLAGRIVSAGQSLADKFEHSDPQYRTNFQSYLREVTETYGEQLDGLYSFAVRAVRASQEQASRGVLNKLKSVAERNENPCYICGIALDYTTTTERNSYTCEHVWPQNYGGDSIPENFLPACGDCNWKFKKDFATWAMLSVQALVRGIDPSDAGLGSVESHYRIALHYRAAQRYAVSRRTTLRDAFIAAGPWRDVRVLNRGDTADFFNLANHDPALEID